MRAFARRLGFYAIATWVAVTLNFLLPRMMPGDPAAAMVARFQGKLSPSALAGLRATLGLEGGSLASQYVSYLTHLVRADLGTSVVYFPQPVSAVVARALGWTLLLSGTSLAASFSLGTLLGILTAWRRGGPVDRWLPRVLAFVGAFPYFWLAMVSLYVFGYRARVVPVAWAYSPDIEPAASVSFVLDVARHAALPVVSVVLSSTGGWLLTMRASMVTVADADFVRLANARGLPRMRVLFRYAARNAILPSVTGLGMALGFSLGGALLTEIVFSYPGTGYLLVQAVRSQDYALMQGLFLTITLAVLAANFAVDALVGVIDPRARQEDEG